MKKNKRATTGKQSLVNKRQRKSKNNERDVVNSLEKEREEKSRDRSRERKSINFVFAWESRIQKISLAYNGNRQ